MYFHIVTSKSGRFPPPSVHRQTGSAAYFRGDKTHSYIVLQYSFYLYLRLALTLPPPGSASYSIRALRGSLALHLDKSGARTMTVFAEQIPLLLALLRKPAQSLQCVSYSRYTAWRPRSITTMRDQHS